MGFIKTDIADLVLYEPKVWGDDRGYFYESFNEQVFKNTNIYKPFVQDNQAGSSYGVLRGLHYQLPPFDMAKLVRVVVGEVLDVAVDIRPDSPTHGKHFSVRLSADNNLQLYVPRGFAHGYVVLSEWAVFCYKCDNVYSKENEGGILYNDPALKIDWLIPQADITVSEKDKVQPLFGNHLAFTKAI